MKEDTLAYLANQNEHLKRVVDSLNFSNRLNELTIKLETQNSVATDVNAFYDSAWTKLIILLSLIGILLPFVIQYFQRKDIKELTNNLKDTFEFKLSELKNSNEEKINSFIKTHEEIIEELEKKNEKITIEVDANTLYLQGRTQAIDKDFLSASYSFIRATNNIKKCGRLSRILPTINNLKNSISQLKSDEIKSLNDLLIKSSDRQTIEDFLSEIENEVIKDPAVKNTIKEIREIIIKID